jgi:hypothetical protein
LGQGTIREELAKIHNSPFAVESAHIKFKDSDLSAYVYRSLFDVARQYRESFEVYGDKKSFEWQLIEDEQPVIHTAKKPEPEIPEKVTVPDYANYCLKKLQDSRQKEFMMPMTNSICPLPRAVGTVDHTRIWFMSSCQRLSKTAIHFPNAAQSANWTSVGILAHESALPGWAAYKVTGFWKYIRSNAGVAGRCT